MKENQIQALHEAELLNEDALELVTGGAEDKKVEGGCCGINFACFNKTAAKVEAETEATEE